MSGEGTIRYSEKSTSSGISIENIIYFWDESIEFFQVLEVGSSEVRSSIGLDSYTALRYARMILDKYEGKK